MIRRDLLQLGKRIMTLLIVPVLLVSTGYALYSQNLSVATTATKPSYSAGKGIYLTYTPTVTKVGTTYTHSLAMVVKNRGVTSVTAWNVKFNLPSDAATITCPTTVKCTKSGVTETITNGTANGTITTQGQVTFTFSFKTASATYVLQNVITTGTYATTYQAVAGLTATVTKGASTDASGWFAWPVTYTITNNSGQALSGWQLVAPWDANNNYMNTMSTNVTYVEGATTLTITSTAALAAGASIVVTATIETASSTWTPTITSIKGRG